MGRGGAGRDNTQTRPRFLKKNLKPVPNPFIKIEPCPNRDGTGRVPEKTCLIAIPMHAPPLKYVMKVMKDASTYLHGSKP